MDCIVRRVAKSRTGLSDFHFQEIKTLQVVQQNKQINKCFIFIYKRIELLQVLVTARGKIPYV